MNSLSMFSICSTSNISKFCLSRIEFGHTFVSSQQKFVNDFIYFKLYQNSCLMEFLIFFLKKRFFLPQTAQFDKSINRLCFVFLTISNPNNFVEILFIRIFLVDWLMYLNISLIVLET